MRPRSLRSTQVMYANIPSSRLMITTALIRSIHQGSFTCADLDVRAEALGVLGGHAGDSGDELLVHARAKLDRGAVRADAAPGAPGSTPSLRASSAESSISGAGPLELELGIRSTAGPEKSGR